MNKHPAIALRKNLTRDQQIVICYRAGNSQQEIASAFSLTRSRVNQILKAMGCSRQDNPKTLRRDLYAFIGVNVRISIKKAFEQEAARRKMSVSALSAKLIEDELRVTGVIK